MSRLIQWGLSIMAKQQQMYEDRKEQLLKRYEVVLKMPRKKKKQAKKHLLLDWSINEWFGNQFNLNK